MRGVQLRGRWWWDERGSVSRPHPALSCGLEGSGGASRAHIVGVQFHNLGHFPGDLFPFCRSWSWPRLLLFVPWTPFKMKEKSTASKDCVSALLQYRRVPVLFRNQNLNMFESFTLKFDCIQKYAHFLWRLFLKMISMEKRSRRKKSSEWTSDRGPPLFQDKFAPVLGRV